MNNKSTLVSDALSLTMGTCGVLHELLVKINIDYKIDELDDSRREEYINYISGAIEELKKFKEIFKNKEFNLFVNKFIIFLKYDIKKQTHFEKLSDDVRDILHETLVSHKERLQIENENLEFRIFTKDTCNIKINY